MSCEIDRRDEALHLRGEMTIYGAAALKDELFRMLSKDPGTCAVDLGGVSEFDTTGLQILLMARRECAAHGSSLCIRNPSDAVREAIGLLRLGDFLAPTGEVAS